MYPALLAQELRFQLRHGFGLAYLLVLAIYLVALYLVPPLLRPVLLAFMLLSDPLTVGLLFVGGVIQLEEAMRLTPPLFVTPLTPSRFLLSRVTAYALLGATLGLILLLLSPQEAFSASSLRRGWVVAIGTVLLLPASALLTLLGAGVAYRVRSINGYILAIVPLLLLVVAPLLGWLPQLAPSWFVWSPTYLPVTLLAALFGIIDYPETSVLLPGVFLFVAWAAVGAKLASTMLRRQLRRSVGGA